MKKLICTLLVLCMISALVFPVFALETTTATGVYTTGITLPAAGGAIPADSFTCSTIVRTKVETKNQTVDENGNPVEETKTENKEFSASANAVWTETDSPDTPITAATFVAGKKYRLTVTVVLSGSMPEFTSATEYCINGTNVNFKSISGNTVVYYGDFTAALGNITPVITMKASGGKMKTYDGKATTLEAAVDKIDGVTYRYVWYRNSEILKDKTESTISLKNVADSGLYYCTVYASATGAAEKSAKSEEVEINISTCLVTINIQDAEKNLFDPDPEFTYEVLGNPPDSLTGKLTRVAGEDIGTYSIEIGTLAFPDSVAKNYEVLVTTGTLTILNSGNLPFNEVTNLDDQSGITGKNDSKIRISASKGSIADNAVLSLAITEDAVLDKVSKEYTAKMMKSFTLKLNSADGKALSLPKHGTLRIQIPLTEAEEVFRPETIRCAFYYNSETRNLKVTSLEENGVRYLSVEVNSLGTITLFEGMKALNMPVSESEVHVPGEEKEKSGSLWMWILIIALALLAIGAMIFTSVQSKRAAMPSRNYPRKNAPLSPERQQEMERAKRIADEINAMAPVPELDKTNPHQSGMVTRPIPGAEPATPAPKNRDLRTGTPMDPNADVNAAPKPRKISFEDLE